MKKPQWITTGIAVCLVLFLFQYGKILPPKKVGTPNLTSILAVETIAIDSLLTEAKKFISKEQAERLSILENNISKGDGNEQLLTIYHQLAHFWGDSARIFEPYAWYEAEAARLENSEKNLTFAAHLFLENLQADELPERRRWKALQAKDLFERSLQINPENDSAKVGLGACFIYGNISSSPMEGIGKILKVVEKDSANIYAQLTLAKGSMISGQFDKAITRLESVHRMKPENLEAIMLLADLYEGLKNNPNAISWYQKSLLLIKRQDIREEIEKRINALKKGKKD